MSGGCPSDALFAYASTIAHTSGPHNGPGPADQRRTSVCCAARTASRHAAHSTLVCNGPPCCARRPSRRWLRRQRPRSKGVVAPPCVAYATVATHTRTTTRPAALELLVVWPRRLPAPHRNGGFMQLVPGRPAIASAAAQRRRRNTVNVRRRTLYACANDNVLLY